MSLSPRRDTSHSVAHGVERQRDADRVHVGQLADMFANNEWAPASQLTFAIDEDDVPQLVDGQHRLRAALSASWTGPWAIRVLWNHHQAASVYTLLDAHQKRRTASVIGRAVGLDGLSEKMTGLIIGSSRYINEWDTTYNILRAASNLL